MKSANAVLIEYFRHLNLNCWSNILPHTWLVKFTSISLLFSCFYFMILSKCSYLMDQNFLFTTKDENSVLKAIDFGLSDFVRPGFMSLLNESVLLFLSIAAWIVKSFYCFIWFADERLNDIVGSAYYVAPEVLHRSYSTEADVWSIGVIAYILLCGSRPFWARTESGIFRAVLKADPSFDEAPWPSLSSEARDFVKRLLNKDPRKRLTAAQALSELLICYQSYLFFCFWSAALNDSYCRSSVD